MSLSTNYDVIIVGGSYAGLAAAMALGRAMRRVLVIDSGRPCNAPTPRSHNFLTQDGSPPHEISRQALRQVLVYDTVTHLVGEVTNVVRRDDQFQLWAGDRTISARKILFATGLRDTLPDLPGFKECWGISVLHCPYCHGYEVRNEQLGVLANGEVAFDLSKLISNWTGNLTLYTNGVAQLSVEQIEKLSSKGIVLVEKEIRALEHESGSLRLVRFEDGTYTELSALFTRLPFVQQSELPRQLGCEISTQNLLKVDEFQRTTVQGIYAAGDNSSLMRAVAGAVAAGTKAGASINRDLIEESFS